MIGEATRVAVAMASALCFSTPSTQTPSSLGEAPQTSRSVRAPHGTHYNCTDTSIQGTVQGEGESLMREGRLQDGGSQGEEASLLGLSDIVVTAYLYNSLLNLWIPVGVGETDLTGVFIIPLTVYGTYRIEFWDPFGYYETEYYNDKATFSAADNITVNSSNPIVTISATLEIDD